MATLQIENPELVTFIHNKRCGGTSISKWLTQNFVCRKLKGKHTRYSKVARSGNIGYSFAVVRNPWDRCVSAFFYQKRKIEERKAKIARGKGRKFSPLQIKTLENYFDMDFSEWLILNKNWNYLNVSQFEFVNGVDYILRFENINEDFKILQDKLKCYKELPKRNSSEHASYRNYYTQEAIDLVSEKCATDIKYFNYEF